MSVRPFCLVATILIHFVGIYGSPNNVQIRNKLPQSLIGHPLESTQVRITNIASTIRKVGDHAEKLVQGIRHVNGLAVVRKLHVLRNYIPLPIRAFFAGVSTFFKTLHGSDSKRPKNGQNGSSNEELNQLPEEIQKQTEEIGQEIYNLKLKLDKLSDYIDGAFKGLELLIRNRIVDYYTRKMRNILEELKYAVRHKNIVFLNRFIDSCAHNGIGQFPSWFRDEILSNSPQSTRYQLIRDKDVNRYYVYVQELSRLYYESTVIRGLCEAARYSNLSDSIKESVVKVDAERAKEDLDQIANQIRRDTKVLEGYFGEALDLVQKMDLRNTPDVELCEQVYRNLSSRFQHGWFVGMTRDPRALFLPNYEDQVFIKKVGDYLGYYRKVTLAGSKTLILGSYPLKVRESWFKIGECFPPCDEDFGETCEQVTKKVQQCVEKHESSYLTLGCIPSSNGCVHSDHGTIVQRCYKFQDGDDRKIIGGIMPFATS